jgi:DNA invertase Pin-like site-specific DNA recombinase
MTKAYSYIRMSTDKQLKGDSLRRQIQASEEFAREHGLTLDDTFKLRDIGLSGYDGSNLEKGQLGKFLQAVKAGNIESGSYLIIESFDRLSRLPVMEALQIFLDLLNHDIKIATLIDNRLHTRGTTNYSELQATLSVMERANEESRTKSHRQHKAWENKRDNAHKKIITKQCPGWVKPRHDDTGFDLIPDRVEIVRRIFEFATGKTGADWIARELNRKRVPTFGRSDGWHKSYVLKILGNKAVLGECQPHTTVGGKRVPSGELLKGYYPAVITEELFYTAQASLHDRRLGAAGRKGERISNLFSGIARCGVCGGSMRHVNKGKKSGRSLQCDQAHRNAGCRVGTYWKYDDFETSFFTFIREANLPKVMGTLKPRQDRAKLEAEIKATEGRLIEAEKRRRRAYELYTASDQPTEYMRGEFGKSEAAAEARRSELDDLKQRLSSLDQEETAFNESKEGITDLIARLQSKEGEDIVRLRSATAQKLRDIVSKILVWPGGTPRNQEAVDGMHEMYPEILIEEIKEYLPLPGKDRRAFYVAFKDGTFRMVSPTLEDPTKFRAIAATSEPLITDRKVRDYLATFGVDDPTPGQYEGAAGRLQEDPADFVRRAPDITSAERNRGKTKER